MPKTPEHVLLVGAGPMARAYAAVLKELKRLFTVVGRGEESARTFEREIGVPVIRGGIDAYIARKTPLPAKAIVAVPVTELGKSTRDLLAAGIRDILVEKPAGLDEQDIGQTETLREKTGARVVVAYNRRFYASTEKARALIAADGGVTSFTFDFTERSSEIETLPLPAEVKREWFLANSSHVTDLAFFLGGRPRHLDATVAGALPWHPQAAVFAGHGETENGILFSYHADWSSGGRWSVTLCTPRQKLVLQPLETLKAMARGSFDLIDIPLDDALDKKFKPGIYRETEAFLAGTGGTLCTLAEHTDKIKMYRAIETGKRFALDRRLTGATKGLTY